VQPVNETPPCAVGDCPCLAYRPIGVFSSKGKHSPFVLITGLQGTAAPAVATFVMRWSTKRTLAEPSDLALMCTPDRCVPVTSPPRTEISPETFGYIVPKLHPVVQARQDKARQGKAGRGRARQCKARQGRQVRPSGVVGTVGEKTLL
jgi:hypothetical protein